MTKGQKCYVFKSNDWHLDSNLIVDIFETVLKSENQILVQLTFNLLCNLLLNRI